MRKAFSPFCALLVASTLLAASHQPAFARQKHACAQDVVYPIQWEQMGAWQFSYLGGDIPCADLRGVTLQRIEKARAGGARLYKTEVGQIIDTDFNTATIYRSQIKMLSDVNLDFSEFRENVFVAASFSGVSIEDASLSETQFEAAHFSGVSFKSSWLSGVKIESSYLGGGTSFEGAILEDVSFKGCSMTEVRFQGARMANVDMRGVYFGGTDLRDVDLSGVDLRGAVYTNPARLPFSVEEAKSRGMVRGI